MLKKRIIVGLLFNDGVLFRSKRFNLDYRYTVNFVDVDGADELLVVDVTRERTPESKERFFQVAAEVLDLAALPVTIGGWLSSVDDVNECFDRLPCDGVVVGRAARQRPEFITEIANKFGSQACTVAVDYEATGLVRGMDVSALAWAAEAARRGSGQLLLQSVERDGSLSGYDLELLRRVVGSSHIPVLACGGCGAWSHMAAAFSYGADGAVTTNIFHFTRAALRGAREYLLAHGCQVRPAA